MDGATSRVRRVLGHVCEAGSVESDISTSGCAAEEGPVVAPITGTLGAEVTNIDLSAVGDSLSQTIDEVSANHCPI